ncbi:pyruvate carboxylase [Psychroflexus planctonicus]|uniref:Pyruvate carboxylase n=1 Tax=Psychroflexus planctonicus TaxID=1526575 RepID=A0ABQ1SGI9_9FLAO|nr:pyruvate carboxylase [Psychroflexus planctonicus]GGE33544.1 pyruvate carboxylase [Psychroflexus planctonicus]
MKIKKVLVANRGEIAIRIFRACTEMGIRTVGVYTFEDRYSLHRYKADESYQVGQDEEPLKPYLDIDEIIRVAKKNNVDAIHPGYGFLSENAKFAKACEENNIIFVGPKVSVLESLGDKIMAKTVAIENDIPIIESNQESLTNLEIATKEANRIGFPLMLKAASGGGGRGMRVLRSIEELKNAYTESKREAKNAFGDETVFLEKFVENPKHIEVQIVADNHGNTVHLFERDCSVQRRYQKVIELAPSYGLSDDLKEKLYAYAVKICKAVNYNNVGTVEFLVDDDGSVYFIEVNPRIQVEHTVTEVVTGVDLIKTQLYVAGGYPLNSPEINIESQEQLELNGFAVQCRITTEDPKNDFKPDYGTITTYRSASGFGIRLDAGSIYQGATISPFFDSMLVKISASSRTLDDACKKMRRALAEFRVRGVKTNIAFLDNILKDQTFRDGKVTVNYIKNTPELFDIKEPRNRATKLVSFLGDVTVNGNPNVKKKNPDAKFLKPAVPKFDVKGDYPKGTKDKLTELGPEQFANWLKNENKIQYTDTTMRDAHQSLLATRMRTYDMMKVAEGFAKNHPEVFSMEVWGGATFDVCMRFLYENPWERLRLLRKAMPNMLLQMLLRGSNGVGYTAYPDNLIEKFVTESWENGVDIFRIFDSQNWMKSIEPCIQYVRNNTQGLAEAAMCYTGDILDPNRKKYTLKYYLQLAKDLENAGAHILAIKDMAGLLKPKAATELITALKSEINIPIHLHTHDTTSMQASTYLNAVEAGVDVVDVALGGLSGLTSQPNFNAFAEVMKYHKRENPQNLEKLNEYSIYWEQVRTYYYPFESGLKSGSGEVYKHEIPGGQYSNLKPQAESLGLADRFHEITDMYAQVNQLFGDIIKVTPSSKVVGDMAQYLVSNNLSIQDVLDKGESLSFPQSVINFFKGDLGQPVGGFPERIQKIILKGDKPYTDRPNAHLEPIDFDKEFKAFQKEFADGMDRELEITDFLSYKLYPKVFKDAHENHAKYGNVFNLPTKNFFYGMEPGEEIVVELDRGKTLLITFVSFGEVDDNGLKTVFFKVNGQTRTVLIRDESIKVDKVQHQKIDKENEKHIGAPLQGSLTEILVKKGDTVEKNQALFVIEAMKMETTVTANASGKVEEVVLQPGVMVFADDLVIRLE